jgi:hypothetical protein
LASFNEIKVIRPEPNGLPNYPIIREAVWVFTKDLETLKKTGDISKTYYLEKKGAYYKYDYLAPSGSTTREWGWYQVTEGIYGEGDYKLNSDYEYKNGSYIYNLRNIAVFLYGLENSISPQFGVPKVSQNFWKIIDERNSAVFDEEFFSFERLNERETPLTSDEYGSIEVYDPKKDSTVLKCYAALKKAVAMAGYLCTALPLHPYQNIGS